MKHQSIFQLFSLTLVALLLPACVAYTAPLESVPVAESSTPVPAADTPTSVQPTVQPYELIEDITYQTDGSDYAQERGQLDIYLPKDKQNFPVLVWFHGGALRYESKKEFYARSVARRFASEGIAVVLPNYRLYPQAKYPDFIKDAASAVAWVYQNIGTYQGNPEQLFVGGHSSGAYLAAMVAMDERYLKEHHLSPEQIAGVIPLSGEMHGDSKVVWEEQGILKTTITKPPIDETAPIFYVRPDVPPFLCMCAEFDEEPREIVCEENEKFIEALRAAGNENVTFKQIPNHTHFSAANMSKPDTPAQVLMLEFIQTTISGE